LDAPDQSADWMNSLVNIEFAPLVQRRQEIPRVARWWCDEWGLPERHPSFTAYVQELEALSPDTLPLHLIAEREGRALGVATLKAKVDHLVARGCSYWLSGVYVEPTSRGQGIATALCQKVVEAARTHAIETLYLQTEHLGGGLYSRLGWRRLQAHHEGGVDQVVMVKDLALKDRERGGITGR
jgi:GNAT superfamily N-acetyltransferase